jgi:short-subunit dehydrogenase
MSQTIVVTGASAGVGRAVALLFGKKRFRVGLISRNQERLESLKQEIERAGGSGCIALCDVANFQEVEEAASKIERELGPIDIWINNAMVSVFSPFEEMTDVEFKRVTDVTYLGYVYGTQVALKRMKARNRGTIIQVGSALAYRSIPLQSAYCGAKHAVKGFTESLRTELIHQKSPIQISMVHLPAINTPQFNWVKSRLPRKPQPVPPIFQPEVAAEAIFWATFHHRREWFLGGNTLLAIWGNKFFPSLLDRHLAKHGFESQQYNGPDSPQRPNNLFESVSGPFGAHGDFDARSKKWSFQFWLSKKW